MPEDRHILRIAATVFCGTIAGGCGLFYFASGVEDFWKSENFGLAVMFPFIAGAIWAWAVFPKMGRSPKEDVAWILTAFPAVGCLAGLPFMGFGSIGGIGVAVTLPLQYPWPIGVVYILSAWLAFKLPRLQLE